MIGYDQGTHIPDRKYLRNTYILSNDGLFDGLGKYFTNPLHKPIIAELHRWDISGNIILATQFSWKESTYLYVNTSNELNRNNWILDSYKLVQINTSNNEIHEISALGTTTETGSTGNCRLSPSANKASCLQAKDTVIFDLVARLEIFRYTNKSDYGNFDRLEWLSDDELVLYEEGAGNYKTNILRLNVHTGEITEVCDTNVDWFMWDGVLRRGMRGEDIKCSELPEFAVLFGSKEWPVEKILPSSGPAGDRFYFYVRWKGSNNLLYNGKSWIEGYDRETGDTFYVKTINSHLKSIFGDSFIVDWFGWQTVL